MRKHDFLAPPQEPENDECSSGLPEVTPVPTHQLSRECCRCNTGQPWLHFSVYNYFRLCGTTGGSILMFEQPTGNVRRFVKKPYQVGGGVTARS